MTVGKALTLRLLHGGNSRDAVQEFKKFTRNFFLATLTTYSRHLSENYFLRNKLETKAVPLATLHTDHTHVMVSKAS